MYKAPFPGAFLPARPQLGEGGTKKVDAEVPFRDVGGRKIYNRGVSPIVKISCLAKTPNDALRLIQLAARLQKEKIPHIIIGMGRHGVITRVLSPLLGSTIMFAPLKRTQQTAPGQLTIAELKAIWKTLKPS